MGKRTDKYKKVSIGQEVDLVPFMNLLAILIPALMVSTEYIKIAMIAVSSPRIGPSTPTTQEQPDKPPLNLTVAISSLGFYIASSNNVLPGAEDQAAQAGPTIPKATVKVYKAKGEDGRVKEIMRVWDYKGKKYILGAAEVPGDKLQEMVEGHKASKPSLQVTEEMDHNYPALKEKLVNIKKSFENEKQVIISAEPNTKYTTIVRVMDAARKYKKEDKDEKEEGLFPVVVLSAGVV